MTHPTHQFTDAQAETFIDGIVNIERNAVKIRRTAIDLMQDAIQAKRNTWTECGAHRGRGVEDPCTCNFPKGHERGGIDHYQVTRVSQTEIRAITWFAKRPA